MTRFGVQRGGFIGGECGLCVIAVERERDRDPAMQRGAGDGDHPDRRALRERFEIQVDRFARPPGEQEHLAELGRRRDGERCLGRSDITRTPCVELGLVERAERALHGRQRLARARFVELRAGVAMEVRCRGEIDRRVAERAFGDSRGGALDQQSRECGVTADRGGRHRFIERVAIHGHSLPHAVCDGRALAVKLSALCANVDVDVDMNVNVNASTDDHRL